MSLLRCTVELPPGYRVDELVAFHRRDPQAVAESVDGNVLWKGLAWGGRPARLSVSLHASHADAELSIDGEADAGGLEALQRMLRHMLGLNQQIEEFEHRYRADPQLGQLIAAHPGLRVAVLATPFEALSWAITGQQISVHAAIALRRRLIVAAGLRHSSESVCYPDAEHVAALSEQDLLSAGLSHAKARTLMTVAQRVAENQLPLDEWLAGQAVDDLRRGLSEIRGIGPWTIDYTLLRGFGWLDGSLHGDAGVRRGLQALLGRSDRIGEDEAKRWLADFSPWRALIAAHLWSL